MGKLAVVVAGLVLASVCGVAAAALDRDAPDVAGDSHTESVHIMHVIS